MIRLLLYSRDPQLHPTIAAGLHTAGLSASFTVAIDSSRNRVKELVSQQRFDAVLFDFDSSQASEQLAFLDELGQQGIPIVALADDGRSEVVDRIRPLLRDESLSARDARRRVVQEHDELRRMPGVD